MSLTQTGAYQLARLPQGSATTMYGTVGGGEQFDPNLYASLLNTSNAIEVQSGGATSRSTPTQNTRTSRNRQRNAALQARADIEALQDSRTSVSGTPTDNATDELIRSLLSEYSNAYTATNRANEQRYAQILAGHNQRIDLARDMLQGLGTQERQDIIRAGEESKATRHQDLVRRGLTGSTIELSNARAADEDTQAALMRLNDMLRREQLAYETQLTGDRLGFMERRTDTGPDLSTMLALVAQLGAS